ncbi:MAG TPA: PAS domain S-box protein [Puia sp.]|nr:PAS domain S-box protein [Puia sp.]
MSMNEGGRKSLDFTRAYRDSEEQYHKMIEEVEDYAILLLDSHGIIQNWNKGAEKIKGYKEQEIVGTHFRIFYTPEDQASELPEKLVQEAKTNGKAIHEGWRVRKDGTTFWGSIVITALHDEARQVIGFSKVTRDLTERKQAEDKLLQYARQLEIQNRELQQFAYAAAHDMKEPLRKIQFYYSSILESAGGLTADKQRNYLMRSADAAKRMQGLIDDLLAFAKMSEYMDTFEEVDLNAVLNEVILFYQETIDSMQGVITASPLPKINGIPYQIRQLFLNLLSNSLKYHDPGRPLHVEISSERIQGLREGSIQVTKALTKISIKDNGIGFNSEQAEKIFEMFERLHGREKYAGTGIGLSICRKVMDNHLGFIRAKGHVGRGAIFEIFFPL